MFKSSVKFTNCGGTKSAVTREAGIGDVIASEGRFAISRTVPAIREINVVLVLYPSGLEERTLSRSLVPKVITKILESLLFALLLSMRVTSMLPVVFERSEIPITTNELTSTVSENSKTSCTGD